MTSVLHFEQSRQDGIPWAALAPLGLCVLLLSCGARTGLDGELGLEAGAVVGPHTSGRLSQLGRLSRTERLVTGAGPGDPRWDPRGPLRHGIGFGLPTLRE